MPPSHGNPLILVIAGQLALAANGCHLPTGRKGRRAWRIPSFIASSMQVRRSTDFGADRHLLQRDRKAEAETIERGEHLPDAARCQHEVRITVLEIKINPC
jgi:hypothetical protein